MRVFRLSRRKYAAELSGMGAARFGNRWNSKGVEMIYAADSRSLAMAEVAVHLTLATLPGDYVMMEIEIPDTVSATSLEAASLSENWNANPPVPETQSLGDDFIHSGEFCLMKVPSAVVKGDFNILINPHHPDFRKIRIVEISDFPFDKRIFK